MKITKLGHCCLLVESEQTRILTDPGAWTSSQNSLTGLDAILITHEHADHFHLESVQAIMAKNPELKIFTNLAVGKLLTKAGLPFEPISPDQRIQIKGLSIEGHGQQHAQIYETYGQVENTGFMIGDKLFYPGDSFYNPKKYVEVLALPVAGPWMKISDAIDYARAIHPKICFPVHDGYLQIRGFIYNLVKIFVEPFGIEFRDTDQNNVIEI